MVVRRKKGGIRRSTKEHAVMIEKKRKTMNRI